MKKLETVGKIVFISFCLFLLGACQENTLININNDAETENGTLSLKSENINENLLNLTAFINTMINQGILNVGNGNALITKINSAINSLNRGNINAASGQLNAYINQISDFLEEGKINMVKSLSFNAFFAFMSAF